MDAIVATVTHQISNAGVEATNNKIKLSIRMAYGFRNIDSLILNEAPTFAAALGIKLPEVIGTPIIELPA